MKITLIKPGMGAVIEGYNIDDGRMEPLQLAILAAMVGDNDTVCLYDDRVEAIPFDEATDLVAITVDSFNAFRAYQISAKFRERGIRVVLGGIHVTLLPEEAADHADVIVIGDAENVWKQLLNDLAQNNLQKVYQGTYDNPQQGVFPDREILKGKGYLPVSLVQFSRGCNFHCSFCSVSSFFKQSHQCRKIEDVIHEIEKDKLRTILFVDDNMVSNRSLLKEFLHELIPLKVRWASQSSIDMVHDIELMELMARSGCIGHLIGFESINVNTLKWFNKSPNLRHFDHYREAMNIMRDYGFLSWGSFMFGNDYDDLDTISQTVEFAIKSKLTLAFFHVLMPYPGTEIYRQFKEENRLLYDGKWWNHPDFKYNAATFIPRLMSPEALSEATIKANKDFYSYSSIARRLLDTRTNMRNLVNFVVYARLNSIIKSTSV
ncbi:MAG: radical SAM protein [Bacteroidota bacterium]